MTKVFIVLLLLCLSACNHHVYFHRDGESVRDTLIIRDTVIPKIVIVRDTITPDTIRLTQKVIEMPLNPWPGMILPFDNIRSDTVYRVWLQWGFMGPWHQYLLNDTVR